MPAAPQEPTFIIPGSLGENPFPERDGRHGEWGTWSLDALAALSRLCDSLQELKAVGDAQAYHQWRERHIELAPPEQYDRQWVDGVVRSDQAQWVVARFYKMASVAFQKFVRGPEDLEFAKRTGSGLAATLSGVLRAFPDSRERVAQFRKWCTPSKSSLKRLKEAETTVAPKAAGDDEPYEHTIEPSGMDRGEVWVRGDANYSKEPPRFFRPIAAGRRIEISKLWEAAHTIVENELPKTRGAVISCLSPAVADYAIALFDASAEAELLRLGSRVKATPFAKWLESKCLPAVVEDASVYMHSQFPVTIGHLTRLFGENRFPETRRALFGAWMEWNPFSDGSLPRQASKFITARLDARRAYWEGRAGLPSTAARASETATNKAPAKGLSIGDEHQRRLEKLATYVGTLQPQKNLAGVAEIFGVGRTVFSAYKAGQFSGSRRVKPATKEAIDKYIDALPSSH
jgi:hypothetical protein